MHNQLDNIISHRWNAFRHACMPYVPIGFILLLGFVGYANTLDIPLQFDDSRTLRISASNYSELFSLHGIVTWPRWFTDVTFAVNRSIHGERVQGYHLFNLAIHLLSASVIYQFATRAIDALKQSFQILTNDNLIFLQRFIPFTTAALFVCHPIQTQSVSYIAQRYTSLATLLYLSSLLAYLQARIALTGQSKNHAAGFCFGVGAFVLGLLALKSKQIAFTLPLMLGAVEVTVFRGCLLRTRSFWVGCSLLLAGGLAMFCVNFPCGLLDRLLDATIETRDISRVDYLLTQSRVVVTYLRLLLLPINQNLDYDYPLYHSLLELPVALSLLLHISLAGLTVTMFIRSQRQLISVCSSSGLWERLFCLGVAWFYIALIVESSLIPIKDVINEHRLYLPSVGFFLTAAACLAGYSYQDQRLRRFSWGLAVLVCVVLTSATIARNRVWTDEMTLWQDVLTKSPDKARARHAVGTIYFKRFMPEKALPFLVRAVELDPGDRKYWITLNEAVAALERYRGRSSSGMEYHLTRDTINPSVRTAWIAISYNNLGLAYEQFGNLPLARESFEKAAFFNQDLDLAWYNLALLSARLNDSGTLTTSLEKLRTINPQLEKNALNNIRAQARSIQLVPQ